MRAEQGEDVREVEALAEQICNGAGGNWQGKHTKREHWRKRARRMIQTARSHPGIETLHRASGWPV